MVEINLEGLMNQQVEAPLSTTIIPCPEGEYAATVEKLDLRTMDTKNGTRAILSVSWNIQDDGAKSTAKRDPLLVRQDVWLDLDDTGKLDTSEGSNIDLGQVRAAVGQNNPGPWQFGMLSGAGPALVRVTHRTDEKTGRVFDEIRRVAKMG